MNEHLEIDSPIGRLLLRGDGTALTSIDWMEASAPPPLSAPEARADPVLREATAQLRAYFNGRLREFDVPLSPASTAFQQRVRQAMCAIPCGETRSYGDLAKEIGSAPRAVGGACGRNPVPIIVPCHRVLAAGTNGGLGGYSGHGGLATKRLLLELEGGLPDT